MKKLVFIFDVPALKNDVQKFSLDELLESDYEIEIVDASPVLNPDVDKALTADRFCDERFAYQTIRDYKTLVNYIRDNREAFFFPMFDHYYETRIVYRLFTKYKVRYGYVNNAMTDLVLKAEVEDAEDYSENHTFMHYVKAFYHRIGRYLTPHRPAEFIVFGGTAGEDSHFHNGECKEGVTKRVYLWTYNYEAFDRTEAYNNGGKKYAVFLDQYMPYHPDVVIKRGAKINPEQYFQEVNEVFDYAMEKYGVETIIAAHPRADYRQYGDVFHGRQIIYGKTSELIKGCEFIFSNSSGANAYAAIANKPIVLINRKATQDYAHATNLFEEYVNLLQCSAIRVQEDIAAVDYYHINTEAYSNFWKLYVMSAEEKKQDFWKEVLKNVEGVEA